MQTNTRPLEFPDARGITAESRLYDRVLGVGTTLWLWVVVVAAMDVVFTYHGLQIGLVEVNPIGQLGFAAFGSWSLIGGKFVALGIGAVGWLLIDRYRLLVPAVFLICWGGAALSNVMLIAATL